MESTAPRQGLERLEWWVAVALTALLLGFHGMRFARAGGLWRDEAAAVQLANLPKFSEVSRYFSHEAFPLLFPLTVRSWTSVVGNSDLAWRGFGFLVGTLIIAALWWNLRSLRRGVPLMSLALFGFNAAVVCWGDTVRGYGLGVLLVLLVVPLMWRVTGKMRLADLKWPALLCAMASLACVQCLFANSVLLLAFGAGTMAVSTRNRQWPGTLAIMVAGIIAALSLIPYLGAIGGARDWDMLVRVPVTMGYVCARLGEALAASGVVVAVWWVLLLVAAGVACFAAQLPVDLRRVPVLEDLDQGERNALLFSGVSLAVGWVAYFVFLLWLSYPMQTWYFMALLALTAICLDLTFDALKSHRWVRFGRLGLSVGLAAASVVPLFQAVMVRQTSIDLVAAKLNQQASKGDLIVVTPWLFGMSFERYYRGSTDWLTIPPIKFHSFHRYDLVKPYLVMPDQDAPIHGVLQQIETTLKSGHRVWVAGKAKPPRPGFLLPTLSPAPDPQVGWENEAYAFVWSSKMAAYLQAVAATAEDVALGYSGKVHHLEEVPLQKFEGWGGL